MPIVVVGLPRSGTSMVSNILQALSVSMNAEGNPDEYNEQGYGEDRELVRESEKILEQVGGTWLNPPALQDVWNVSYKPNIDRTGVWGWKDPRLCLTLKNFLPYLIQPKIIVVERKRESVVQSLMRFKPLGLADERLARLFCNYLSVALEANLDFVVNPVLRIQYEDALARPLTTLKKLADFVGVKYQSLSLINPLFDHSS